MTATELASTSPLRRIEPRRVCIIKPSALGDVVQTLPVLGALRQRFSRAHIAWVVNHAYASLLTPIPHLDEVIPFDRERYRGIGPRNWQEILGFFRGLSERRFDLAIDLQGLLRSGLMTWATRASCRVGLTSAREGARLFYTYRANDLPIEQGAVERYWKVVEALGAGECAREYSLALSPLEQEWACWAIGGLPRPIVALNPGARWQTKRWPADRFADVTDKALGRTAGSAVVLGGPGEEPFADIVAARLHLPCVNLCGRTSLRQLAALLQQCDLLLTNDSGPMHLAAAVGTSTVSIFTCTSPVRAAPTGAAHCVAQTSVSCKGSYRKTCDRMICMQELSADKVLPVLENSLSQIAPISGDDTRAA